MTKEVRERGRGGKRKERGEEKKKGKRKVKVGGVGVGEERKTSAQHKGYAGEHHRCAFLLYQ